MLHCTIKMLGVHVWCDLWPLPDASGAWQEVKGETMAVNEAAYSGLIVWLWRQRNDNEGVRWVWLCRGGGVAPPTQEMRWALVWAVWRNGLEGVVCILALWMLCGFHGIVCGLPVDFGGISTWGLWGTRQRMLLLWVWSGTSLPALTATPLWQR